MCIQKGIQQLANRIQTEQESSILLLQTSSIISSISRFICYTRTPIKKTSNTITITGENYRVKPVPNKFVTT